MFTLHNKSENKSNKSNKRQATNQRKIFEKHISEKELTTRIRKNI